MEGVEDIPEPVLSAGIPWAWESFPDYMDWLSKRRFDMDIGAQLPHAALARLCDGRTRRATAIPPRRRTTGDGRAGRRCRARRRAGIFDLAHPQPPHLDRRLHPDAEGRRGRADGDRRRHAQGRPQRVPVRARSVDHRRRPADDAAGGGEHQNPGVVLDHPERQGAAALAPDARHHQRGFRARAVDHGADRRAPGRAAARAGTVAQPVPDPAELSRDRPFAAGGAVEAPAPARRPRRDPERDADRDRRSAVLPAELRQDVSARQSAGLRAAAGKHPGRAGPPPGPAAGRTGL